MDSFGHAKLRAKEQVSSCISRNVVTLNNMAGPGAGMTLGLLVRRASAPDVARNDDDENDNVEDNALVLTCDQLQQVDEFRSQLLDRTDDADKFELCAEKCNELLRHDTGLQILIAAYDDVMSAACRGYENKKQEKTSTRTPLPTGRNKKTDNNAERDEWERYFGVATSAAQVKSKCLVALKAVAKRWGREVVLYYEWASRGESFCNLLRAGALHVPNWGDAALALNIIMCRRHTTVRRAGIDSSRDPITQADLKELKRFSVSEIRDNDLPAGFGRDKFGIVVCEKFAVPRPKPPVESRPTEFSDAAGDSDLSAPPGTDFTELSEPDETNSLDPPTRKSLRPSTQLSYKETPNRGSGTIRSVPANTSAVSKALAPPCCPVSSTLLGTLDNEIIFNPADFFAIRGQLCHRHTQSLLNQIWVKRPATDQAMSLADPATRRRTTSLPDITQPFKRPRIENPSLFPSVSARGTELLHDQEADEAYRKRALTELQNTTSTPPPNSHGQQTADLVQALLKKITLPNTDRSRGPVDAIFCTGIEAADLIESIPPCSVPIITERQQQFQWSKNGRPILQLFHRMTCLDRTVSVQIPSRSSERDSFEVRTLVEVQKRFLSMENMASPWNILDLQSPLPSSILPNFLTGENSGLLLHVRDAVLMEKSAERVVAPSQNWNQWKNVLEWVLLSEGGHQTAPHMDSNGLSTWITVQEGCIGFGWMASPTEEEERDWMTTDGYIGGRWRYVVLKPGQTIFFTSGTIHFVFRTRAPQTLALGGHVLQWSGIKRWMRIVLAQMANPMITNEDMKQSASMYVHAISKLVETRIAEGRIEELGGDAVVKPFLAAVEEFNRLHVPRKTRRTR
ncbi:hypothetical protein RB600_001488 [Gaeumannomyces tritici]